MQTKAKKRLSDSNVFLLKIYNFKEDAHEFAPLYFLALPGIIALILFNYLPMAGLVIVFKSYTFKDGIFGSKWVGLQNFKFFFTNISEALRATTNTVLLNFLFNVFGIIVAVALAVMINEFSKKWFKKITQSIMFFPYFISWVAIGTIVYTFLEDKGIVNQILRGLGFSPVSWYSEPDYWYVILTIIQIWKMAGYSSIIYFAAITGFDPAYYEAAIVDGASRLQMIFKITIPMLKPTIVIMFLLAIGRILNGDLGMMLGLTNLNPLLFKTTDIVDTYVYRSAIQGGQFEMASAVALYQSVFGFLLVILANWIAGLFDKEYKLF